MYVRMTGVDVRMMCTHAVQTCAPLVLQHGCNYIIVAMCQPQYVLYMLTATAQSMLAVVHATNLHVRGGVWFGCPDGHSIQGIF